MTHANDTAAAQLAEAYVQAGEEWMHATYHRHTQRAAYLHAKQEGIGDALEIVAGEARATELVAIYADRADARRREEARTDFGMYTDEGNAAVAEAVRSARCFGTQEMREARLRYCLEDIAETHEEALDTAVREAAHEELNR